MTAWLVIGFFVALALAILTAAMRTGRRRRRASQDGARLRPAMGLAIGATVVLFGVVVPALVLVYNAETQASAARGGVELTASEEHGREIFRGACGQCHTLADADTVGRVGPDLDVLRPNRGLTLDAIAEGRARGRGQMPPAVIEGQDARDVADYVARIAGR
jgi:mono/diheme cytochrome c family protein